MEHCDWIWVGDLWSIVNDTCPKGCGCDVPDRQGNFLGDTEKTVCNCE